MIWLRNSVWMVVYQMCVFTGLYNLWCNYMSNVNAIANMRWVSNDNLSPEDKKKNLAVAKGGNNPKDPHSKVHYLGVPYLGATQAVVVYLGVPYWKTSIYIHSMAITARLPQERAVAWLAIKYWNTVLANYYIIYSMAITERLSPEFCCNVIGPRISRAMARCDWIKILVPYWQTIILYILEPKRNDCLKNMLRCDWPKNQLRRGSLWLAQFISTVLANYYVIYSWAKTGRF